MTIRWRPDNDAQRQTTILVPASKDGMPQNIGVSFNLVPRESRVENEEIVLMTFDTYR